MSWRAASFLALSALFGCSASEPPAGSVAVVAVGNDPGHFNPAITTAAHVHAVADSIYNGLVGLDRDLTPVPDLAERWEILDGGATYVFHLAPNVRWHDGEPFTSRDVVFTFEEILLRLHSRTRAGLADRLIAIEAPDDHTVRFRFREPYAPLLQRLDVTEAPILPAHVYAEGEADSHPANLAPIGTGPFRLARHQRDDRIELVRNDSYFKPGLPRLDRLVFRVIPDASTRLLALERGEVDFVGTLRASDAARLRASARGITVEATPSGPGGGNCVMSWIFNLDRPPLSELRVRRGLAHALDRQRIVDRVLFGEGSVAEAPISSGIPWAHDAGALAGRGYDPESARELLGELGRPIDIVHFPTFLKYGEILRQQLERVGVELVVRALDRAAAIEAIYERRDFDTALVSYCNGLDPDIGVRRMYDSTNIGPVPFSNAAGYRSDEVDRLLGEAAMQYERDRRRELYFDVQRQVAEDLPYWWLVETQSLSAYDERLRDFAPWSGQFAERAYRVDD